MPESLADGRAAPVRLFIQNVSDRDLFLTVSNRNGYDYATAADGKGKKIPSQRPLVYPSFFSGALRPEINPGSMTQYPPVATLTKLQLQAGATYELKTTVALTYHSEKSKTASGEDQIKLESSATAEISQTPFKTILFSKPTEALVTWHLHTANGYEYASDLKSRLWPARGDGPEF